jgi:putative oxygen-independent coproporphyrinogen III oxidase
MLNFLSPHPSRPLGAPPSPVGRGDIALYIHWPFCAQKCPYCDFNSHVRDKIDQGAWARAYLAELEYYRNLTGPRTVTSIFFGGGTPSLMNPDVAGTVIQKINDLWGIVLNAEITLEANPNSVEVEKFKSFKSNGINRVSIGLQSLDDEQLRFLGRVHTAAEGQRAIDVAAQVFDRYSFDLIYARPGQTAAAWESELRQALAIAGDHLSLYQLTIEPQTPFFTAHARGDFAVPGEDAAAELYTLTDDIMNSAGLPAYEISNYARPGQESRHNLTYWRYGDYVGVGPGAHGRVTVDGVKYATRGHRAPEVWMERVSANGHGMHPFTVVPMDDRGVESVMMGLRLASGFDLGGITRETGQDWRDVIAPERIVALVDAGDITCYPRESGDPLGSNTNAGQWAPACAGATTPVFIAPTLQGRLRLNQVIAFLLGR